MDPRPLVVGGGVALTTFGVVAVAVIETVQVDPGAGILGVGLGAVAGLLAWAVVAARFDDATLPVRATLSAAAAFGYAVLGVLFASYADVAGLRSVVDPTVTVLAGAVAALVVGVGAWLRAA